MPRHPVSCTSPRSSISQVVLRSSGRVLRPTSPRVPGNSISRIKNSAQPPDVLPLPHPPQNPRYLALRPWNCACLGFGLYGSLTVMVDMVSRRDASRREALRQLVAVGDVLGGGVVVGEADLHGVLAAHVEDALVEYASGGAVELRPCGVDAVERHRHDVAPRVDGEDGHSEVPVRRAADEVSLQIELVEVRRADRRGGVRACGDRHARRRGRSPRQEVLRIVLVRRSLGGIVSSHDLLHLWRDGRVVWALDRRQHLRHVAEACGAGALVLGALVGALLASEGLLRTAGALSGAWHVTSFSFLRSYATYER